MIHIIFGAPGSGKSTYNTFLLTKEYWEQGSKLLQRTCEKIDKVNAERGLQLAKPTRPPIYSDFEVKIQTGWNSYFTPFYIDGYRLGFENPDVDVINVAPGAKVHLSEVQRYYDSRKSGTFPQWVSNFYEMHRHFDTDIIMDLQRPGLVDRNIRDICRKFTEVQKMTHDYDDLGRIVRTHFRLREFENFAQVEEYLTNPEAKNYAVNNETYEGNIFKCFESCTYFDKFLPPNGKNFDYLEYTNKSAGGEPEYFRKSKKGET